jgi:hypothetical protein
MEIARPLLGIRAYGSSIGKLRTAYTENSVLYLERMRHSDERLGHVAGLIKTMRLTIYIMITIAIGAFTFVSCLITPSIADRIHDGGVQKVCSKVTPGMSRAELNELLHRHNSYSSELMMREANNYSYSNSNGTCLVSFDSESDKVLASKFFPYVAYPDY